MSLDKYVPRESSAEKIKNIDVPEKNGFVKYRVVSSSASLTRIAKSFARHYKISFNRVRNAILEANRSNNHLNRTGRPKKGIDPIKVGRNIWYPIYKGDILYIPFYGSDGRGVNKLSSKENISKKNVEKSKLQILRDKVLSAPDARGGRIFSISPRSKLYNTRLKDIYSPSDELTILISRDRRNTRYRKGRKIGQLIKVSWDARRKNFYPVDGRKYGLGRMLILRGDTVYKKTHKTKEKKIEKKKALKIVKKTQKEEVRRESKVRRNEFIRGMTYGLPLGGKKFKDISDEEILREFKQMKGIHINSVTLVPSLIQTGKNGIDIKWAQDIKSSPSRGDLSRLVKLAEKAGLEVIVKPWIAYRVRSSRDGDWKHEWSGRISARESSWFDSYEKTIVALATECNKNGVRTLIIGNELRYAFKAKWQMDRWIKIVKKIRSVAPKLRLSYAPHNPVVNGDNEAAQKRYLDFIKSLDFVSVNMWPWQVISTNGSKVPSVEDYMKGFEWWFKNVAYLAKKTGKKIMVTEFGGHSAPAFKQKDHRNTIRMIDRTYHHPIQLMNMKKNIPPNNQTQANLYEAFFRMMGKREYASIIIGSIAWQWTPGVKKYSTSSKRHYEIGFDVFGKRALEVIAEKYRILAARRNRIILASRKNLKIFLK
ncbi:hypothetical protein KKG71_00295 [Patescibacteria group bacterium]|nr:hypothetical protein [Patescibacteria group bacterium]